MRKSFVSGVMVLVAMALVVSACGGEGGVAPTEQPNRSGGYVVGGNRTDSTEVTAQSGGYVVGGNREVADSTGQ